MARLEESGLGGKLPLLVGVCTARLGQVGALDQELTCSDPSFRTGSSIGWSARAIPAAEGRAICIDLLKEFREIAGVGGAHIMAPLNETAIVDVIETLRAAL